jgi:hypothetical protein
MAIARRAPGGWIAAIVLAIVGLVVGVLLLSGPLALGGKGTNAAQAALQRSIPAADTASGTFLGFARYSAAALNRERRDSGVRYVDADSPSTGPSVVSVHVISNSTWAAAALSPENGRCYVIVVTVDRSDPRYGYQSFGWLPKGASCVGLAADPSTATSTTWPTASA